MNSFRSLDRDGLDGVLPAPEITSPAKNYLAWLVLIIILLALISSWLWSDNLKSTVANNSLSNDQKAVVNTLNIPDSEQTQLKLVDTELIEYDSIPLTQNIEQKKVISNIPVINSEIASIDLILNSPPPSAGSEIIQQTETEELSIVTVDTKKNTGRIITSSKSHTFLFKLSTSKVEFLPVKVATGLINFVNQCSYKVRITGHTCNLGPEEFNYQLGLIRANAMRHYLIEQGITPDVLLTHSEGMTSPIASNALWSGRKQNRRVELDCLKSLL